MLRVVLSLFLSSCFLTSFLAAENWPQWRGPNQNGVSGESDLPVQWSSTENVAWRVPLPGLSGSTPVVWNDQIVLCSPGDGKNQVVSFDRDGAQQWQTAIGTAIPGKHKKGSATNPSPVTDGKHLYVYFKSGDVAGLDMDGKVVWQKNLQEMYGEDTLWWDLGTSPVLTTDHVIIAVMHSGPSYLVALDKATGDVVWKADRNLKAPVESAQSYSTPVVLSDGGKETIIVLGADHVTAHDATTGSELWRCGDFNPEQQKLFRSIASPVVADQIVVAPYARGKTLSAIRLGGQGDVTSSHRVWHLDGRFTDVPTPTVADGRLYLLNDRGLIHCLAINSGETIWSEQVAKSREAFSASPILADGKLYLMREDGTAFVLKAGDQFELLATNALDETCIATPVPTQGQLLIRTAEHLYCIGKQ